MEEIEVNGKKYVLKSDIKEQEVVSVPSFKIISKDFTLMDEARVMGIGSFQIGEGFVCVKLSTEYLEKAIKCLKAMSLDTKKGLQSVDLAWCNDKPAIIGVRNDFGEMSGFVIAPQNNND